MLQACLFLINSSSRTTRPVARSCELMNVEWPTFTATFSKIAFLGDNLRAFCRQEPFGRGELATWGRSMAPGSLCPRHWNGARLCRRPAAARGKFEGVGSLPGAAAGRGRHSRAPLQQRGEPAGRGAVLIRPCQDLWGNEQGCDVSDNDGPTVSSQRMAPAAPWEW